MEAERPSEDWAWSGVVPRDQQVTLVASHSSPDFGADAFVSGWKSTRVEMRMARRNSQKKRRSNTSASFFQSLAWSSAFSFSFSFSFSLSSWAGDESYLVYSRWFLGEIGLCSPTSLEKASLMGMPCGGGSCEGGTAPPLLAAERCCSSMMALRSSASISIKGDGRRLKKALFMRGSLILVLALSFWSLEDEEYMPSMRAM